MKQLNLNCASTYLSFTSCLSVRENFARYAASDTAEGADCYSDGDRSNAPQMPVAAYSDLLFSFATVEGTVMTCSFWTLFRRRLDV